MLYNKTMEGGYKDKMDYCTLIDYDYYITNIEYNMLNCDLKFSLFSKDLEQTIDVEITQIKDIVWERYCLESYIEQKQVTICLEENSCKLNINPEKWIWILYSFEINNIDKKGQKNIEIEFDNVLYCKLIADKVLINNQEFIVEDDVI